MLLLIKILHMNIYSKTNWITKMLLNKINMIFFPFRFKRYKMWFGAFWCQVHILSGNGIWCHALLEFVLTNSHTRTRVNATTYIFSVSIKMNACGTFWKKAQLNTPTRYTIYNAAISFCFLSRHISTDVIEILLSISREILKARYLDSTGGDGMQAEFSAGYISPAPNRISRIFFALTRYSTLRNPLFLFG